MAKDNKQQFETKGVSKTLVEAFWRFGISVWNQRNKNEHGNKYIVSIIEKERATQQIIQAFKKYETMENCETDWMFTKHMEKRLEDTYDVQMAWLELLRKLYAKHEFEWFVPDQRTDKHIEYIEENIHGKGHTMR